MGAAYFYHLTRQPLEATLPILLGRALDQSWRVEVRGTRPDHVKWLDEKLWLGPEDGFLPHGLAGGEHDDHQPVLLTYEASANGRDCLMCVDGAETAAEEVNSSQRVCILFDGHDQDALAKARAQWKQLTDAGCAAQYWSEESGRWEKKAEANS